MDKVLESISSFAYSFKQTIQHTYDCAIQMSNAEGDFVECGVGAGAQISAMAYACPNKIIHAYDSYEGIPLAGEFDAQQPGIGEIVFHDKFAPISERLVSSGVTVHSVENVISNIQSVGLSTSNIRFHKGWFQNTIPENKIEKISLLRLDGDLYESTYVCLEHLYDKVIKGGIVIIDDYALEGCRSAINDYFKRKPKLIEVEGGGGVVYFVKK